MAKFRTYRIKKEVMRCTEATSPTTPEKTLARCDELVKMGGSDWCAELTAGEGTPLASSTS